MCKSMTACGQASKETPQGRFTMILQSVNRKCLDFQFSLPPTFTSIEMDIRKKIAKKVSRGHITLFIDAPCALLSATRLTPNTCFAQQYYNGWKQVAENLNLTFSPEIFWSALARQEELFFFQEGDHMEQGQETLLQLVDIALEDLLVMKEKEGAYLCQDLSSRLKIIKQFVSQVQELSHSVKEDYRNRIASKLQEMTTSLESCQENFLREIILYVEKSSIEEELVRLSSHILQFDAILSNPSTTCGERLDFLLQEMHREWTTIGSKSTDANLSHTVVDAKVELRRMREQVQNVE